MCNGCLGASTEQAALTILNASQYGNVWFIHSLDAVAHLPEHLRIYAVEHGRNHFHALYFIDVVEGSFNLCIGNFLVQGFECTVFFFQFCHNAGAAFCQFGNIAQLQSLCSLLHFELCSIQQTKNACTRNSFDSANTRCNGVFRNDAEQAQLCSVINVCTAAEFNGEIRNADNPNNIAVLFAEECHRTPFSCLCNRQGFSRHRNGCQNLFVDQLFDFLNFFLGHSGEV